MSLNFYPLLRPFLFALDAEKAHDVTLDWLQRTQSGGWQRKLYAHKRVEDPVEIAGLRFPNRVGLAAGLDKDARCIDAFAAMGLGFMEVGTVTPLAQSGNSKPRMFRIREANGIINRMGFNNRGLDAFLRNVQASQMRSVAERTGQLPMLLGLNIGKNAITPIERAADDYVTCLRGVYPHADYISINISSPNTKNLRDLQSDTALDKLLERIVQTREELNGQYPNKPIFLKIAPDLTPDQIEQIAQLLQRHRVDGVIATNTTVDREQVRGFPHGREQGGLSGAPVMQLSNEVIRQLRQALGPDYPIIGVGGILDDEDALAKVEAGADLVQIYTGLIYRGPVLVNEVAHALQTYHGLKQEQMP